MAIVRKDKMLAGYNGNLESVIVITNASNKVEKDAKGLVSNGKEITNGVFVVIEGLLEGEREVKKAVLATSTDSNKEVFFIHNSEVMYDERLHKLADFRIKAGKVARAYRLYDGDIITLTTDLFSGTVAVGDKLLVKADGLIGKPATPADANTAKVVFTVIENSGYELDTEMEAFAVQVSRN